MRREAFTLIELLLVVVIVGVIYGLVINSMQRVNDKEAGLDFMTLPAFLTSVHQQDNVALVCIDDCKECALYRDGTKVKEVDAFMRDEPLLHFWYFDANLGTQELRFSPVFDEDDKEFDVCFRYEIFKDGSQTEMIVETKGESFDYRGPFQPVRRFSSLPALEEARQVELQKVLQ